MLEYRPGTMADVPQLCELLSLLFEQESDFVPDARRQTRALEMIVSQPEVGRIFCAVEGGTVVGMVSVLFTVSTAEGGRAAWLEDMIVHPARRRGGIGGHLLQTAIAGAKNAGCTRITLLTDDTNAAAQKFYRRAGFVRSQMIPLRLKI
jgi:ribosomal protein S18 acetylase RimI-like enzyme